MDEHMRQQQEEFVPVPVPRHLVVSVMQFVASQVGSEVEVGGEYPDDIGKEPPEQRKVEPSERWRYSYSWSEVDLKDALAKVNPKIRSILLYLAERPNQEVPTQTLAELVYGEDATGRNLGGTMQALSKRMKRYGREMWPFKVLHPDDEKPYWKYVMYQDTAEKVLRLADELGLRAE